MPVLVDASTQFFFQSANAAADATPIGTGLTFLKNLHRGFKVHVSVVDPLAKTWVADTIEVEIARFDGAITLMSPAGTGFTYTRKFATLSDDYVENLPYLSPRRRRTATLPAGPRSKGSTFGTSPSPRFRSRGERDSRTTSRRWGGGQLRRDGGSLEGLG